MNKYRERHNFDGQLQVTTNISRQLKREPPTDRSREFSNKEYLIGHKVLFMQTATTDWITRATTTSSLLHSKSEHTHTPPLVNWLLPFTQFHSRLSDFHHLTITVCCWRGAEIKTMKGATKKVHLINSHTFFTTRCGWKLSTTSFLGDVLACLTYISNFPCYRILNYPQRKTKTSDHWSQ